MDNFVSINHTKENIICFDISVQGISNDDARVWLTIKTGQMEVSFPCAKKDGDKWECVIPPLPFIQKTAYPCSVSMVADGYYFEPMTGTIDVVGTAEVYTNNMQNVTYGPKREPAAPTATVTSKPAIAIDDAPTTATRTSTARPALGISQAALRAAAMRANTKPKPEPKSEPSRKSVYKPETADRPASVTAPPMPGLTISHPTKPVDKQEVKVDDDVKVVDVPMGPAPAPAGFVPKVHEPGDEHKTPVFNFKKKVSVTEEPTDGVDDEADEAAREVEVDQIEKEEAKAIDGVEVADADAGADADDSDGESKSAAEIAAQLIADHDDVETGGETASVPDKAEKVDAVLGALGIEPKKKPRFEFNKD